jgi:hypothetical protein
MNFTDITGEEELHYLRCACPEFMLAMPSGNKQTMTRKFDTILRRFSKPNNAVKLDVLFSG